MPIFQSAGVEFYSDQRRRKMADGQPRCAKEGCQRLVRAGQKFCWQHGGNLEIERHG